MDLLFSKINSAVCFAYGGSSWHAGLQLPGELNIIHIGNSVKFGVHVAFGYVSERVADLHIYVYPNAYIWRPGWEKAYYFLENIWRGTPK